MRARSSNLAMAAQAEIIFGEHKVCCRGGEIIPATHFPAETSCRTLVRTKGFVTSYLRSNVVSSTQHPSTQMICRCCQEARPTEDVKSIFPSHVFMGRLKSSRFVKRFLVEMILQQLAGPPRLDDGQRAITAARSCDP